MMRMRLWPNTAAWAIGEIKGRGYNRARARDRTYTTRMIFTPSSRMPPSGSVPATDTQHTGQCRAGIWTPSPRRLEIGGP